MDSSSSSGETQDDVLNLILDNLPLFKQYGVDANLIEDYYNKGAPSATVELHPEGSSSSSGEGITLVIELENAVRSVTRPEDPLSDDFKFYFYDVQGALSLSATKPPGVDSFTVTAELDPVYVGPVTFQVNVESLTYETLRRRYTLHGAGEYTDSSRIGPRRSNDRPRLSGVYVGYLAGWLSTFWDLYEQEQDELIPEFFPPFPGAEFDPFQHARDKLVNDNTPGVQPLMRTLDRGPSERIGIEGGNFLGVTREAWNCMMYPKLPRDEYYAQELEAARQRGSAVTFAVAFKAGEDYIGHKVQSVDPEAGTVTIVEDAFFPGPPVTLSFDDIYTITGDGVQDRARLYKTLPREPSFWRNRNISRWLGFDRYPPDGSFDCRSFSAAAVLYLGSQLSQTCPNAKVSHMTVPGHAIVYVDLGGCDGQGSCDPECCTGNFVYEPQTGETWDAGPTFEDDALLYAALKQPENTFDIKNYKLAENPDGSDLNIGVNRVDWSQFPEEVSRIRSVICDCIFAAGYQFSDNSNERKLKDKCIDGTLEDWLKDNFAPGPGKTTLADPTSARPLSCQRYACSDGGCQPRNIEAFFGGSGMSEDECRSYCHEYFGCDGLNCTGEWSSSPFFSHTHSSFQDCLDNANCPQPYKIHTLHFGTAEDWFGGRLGEMGSAQGTPQGK